ncbi:MAG: CarD family transcriptional regulator [Clostridia bacterium]|nr:CarD family transcriptional regulator [Clostridia bacterium]
MFKVGDVIKYGINGICRISGITVRDFFGEKMEYYVLTPLDGRDMTFFVPIKNEALTSKMQYVLSKDELYLIVDETKGMKTEWIDSDKQRSDVFGKILVSKDRRDLISLVRTIRDKKTELEASGKKLHAADERIMNNAERIIADEFAAVLGIKPKNAVGVIEALLG